MLPLPASDSSSWPRAIKRPPTKSSTGSSTLRSSCSTAFSSSDSRSRTKGRARPTETVISIGRSCSGWSDDVGSAIGTCPFFWKQGDQGVLQLTGQRGQVEQGFRLCAGESRLIFRDLWVCNDPDRRPGQRRRDGFVL